MPIVIDKKPGRKALTKAGKAPEPQKAPEVPEQPPLVRVRALRQFGSRHFSHGVKLAGEVFYIPLPLAREWIKIGLVEEDKSLDGAPETK